VFCSVSGRGGLLVRVGAEAQVRALREPHVQAVGMGKKVMTGFVRVAPEGYSHRRGAEEVGRARHRLSRRGPAGAQEAKHRSACLEALSSAWYEQQAGQGEEA
jgi:hypothetical protein